jgi:peptidoglycan/xylan/chitin deacetylase (PgdA/CDA1 family)
VRIEGRVVTVVMPEGKRLAVCLSPDFDAQSLWMATFQSRSQLLMSRGEFGAEVGAPRLLEFYRRYGIKTTWCVPTHTMLTFPRALEAILADGHEIAAHGVYHEYIPKLGLEEERELLGVQVEKHQSLIGRRPRGYRSPALDVTDNTLSLLAEFGFDWDSSLMGRDFTPYHPRMVVDFDVMNGNTFGPSSDVLEFPVSWVLDDFPELESFKGSPLMQSNDAEYCPGGVMTWTLHPQTIGRSHNLVMLQRFIDHVASRSDVWFPTLSEVFDAYQPE